MTIKKRILRRCEAAVTAFQGNRFHRAVLRLTLQYALSVLLILALFSGLIYFLYIRVLPAEPEHHGFDDAPLVVHLMTEPLDHELRENLVRVLLFADVVLFLIALLFGYYFSRATLAPIEQTYLRQRRFTAEAAHELRTPLSVLVAGADYYGMRERTRDDYRVFVDMVKNESKRLSTLSNDLLLLAKGDEGRQHRREKFDMSELVNRAVVMIRPYADTQHCTVDADVPSDMHCVGNPGRLMQVLLNLLKNAVDYNRPKGSVQVALEEDDGDVVLRIRDTGRGIPAHAREAIFERFYRVDDGRESGQQGSGLGLSVVRMIVNEHKGDVTVDSTEGKGTCFTVRLPVAASTDQPV